MKKPTLLIDGDIFLYNATLSAEYETRWDEDTHVLASNYDEALEGFHNQVNRVKEALNATNVRIAFTKGETFRHDIYPPYKNNRTTKRKPLCFARVREQAEADYQCLSIPGLEADDVLGIWATRDKGPYVIVSDDKDLKTIPGKLYRQAQLHDISEAEADRWFLYQALMGDLTDGYPGCPKIGPKRAEALLDESGCTWETVVKAYEKAGLSADYALTQARLARILRASDWDAEAKKVILWSPK